MTTSLFRIHRASFLFFILVTFVCLARSASYDREADSPPSTQRQKRYFFPSLSPSPVSEGSEKKAEESQDSYPKTQAVPPSRTSSRSPSESVHSRRTNSSWSPRRSSRSYAPSPSPRHGRKSHSAQEDSQHLRDLAQPIIDSWQLTASKHINPLITTIAQLQTDLRDDCVIGSITNLAAQYIHEVRNEDLSIDDIVEVLTTLGKIESVYPRDLGSLSSFFAYRTMMDLHRAHHRHLTTWSQQEDCLWQAAYSFYLTGGNPEQAKEVLSQASSWISFWHTRFPQQENRIIYLISQILLLRPHAYSSLLDESLTSFQHYEAFEIIPFLEGLTQGLSASHEHSSPTFSLEAEALEEDDAQIPPRATREATLSPDQYPSPPPYIPSSEEEESASWYRERSQTPPSPPGKHGRGSEVSNKTEEGEIKRSKK